MAQQHNLTREQFLRAAAVGGAALTMPGFLAACGGDDDEGAQQATTGAPGQLGGELRIIQWSHFVPAYDQWFDRTYIKRWGEENDVNVIVDHVAFADLPPRAAAEVSAQSGHDLFWFLSPPAAYEDQVIDHEEIVQEIKSKGGGEMITVCDRSTYNPKTKKRFGFPDNWVPDPVHWRKDLWDEAGFEPNTWDDVRQAGPKLKAAGHPLGIGISQDIDANMALIAQMMCFGSFMQDEESNVTINSPETIEAVNFMADVYKQGMTPEVLSWDASSNNRFYVSGKGSMILNAISAVRTLEDERSPLADSTLLAPIPEGPAGRQGLEHVLGVYVIWKFAKNQEAAKKFLVDLAVNYKEAFLESKFYNFPSFPATVPDLKELVQQDDTATPSDKYAILGTFEDFSVNVGFPGYTTPAIDEVFGKFIIPQIFAQVARWAMSAEDAVGAAESQMESIFQKWRDQGKI
jgi:multiple sugar transport system substrate-binding protein